MREHSFGQELTPDVRGPKFLEQRTSQPCFSYIALSRALLVILVLETGINVGRRACDPMWWTCTGDPSRVYVQDQLMRMPGKHLLMVRYSEDHNIHDEWVYNGADIDGARVVWARELDPEQNAKLFAYFKDRDVWLVEPDTDNTEIKPYTPRLEE